jgi:hypothetical protein
VDLLADIGGEDVTRAAAVAQAETVYQISQAQQAYPQYCGTGVAPPADDFAANQAVAYYQWITAMADDYVTLRTGMTQAAADTVVALGNAAAELVEDQMAAEATYVRLVESRLRTNDVNVAGTWQAFYSGTTARENTWNTTLSGADNTLTLGRAQARRDQAIAAAGIEKQYLIDLARDDLDAHDNHAANLGPVNRDLEAALADAELAWIQTAAQADHTLAAGNVTAAQAAIGAVSGFDTLCANDLVGYATDLNNAYRAAQVAFEGAQTAADNGLSLDAANAAADYRDADYTHLASALATLAANMNIPWAQFQAEFGAVKRDWWDGQKGLYVAYVTAVNGEHTLYQSTEACAKTTLSNAYGAADEEWVSTTADAVALETTTVASAEGTYLTTRAGYTETYQGAIAQPERDYRVALAQAQADLVAGGSQQDYSAAVSAAGSARDAAVKAADDPFAVSEAAPFGGRHAALKDAEPAATTTTKPIRFNDLLGELRRHIEVRMKPFEEQ